MSRTDSGRPDPWSALGSEPGACAACLHARINLTRRGTAYLRCLRASWDARMVRYPRLPVLRCVGLESAGSQASDD